MSSHFVKWCTHRNIFQHCFYFAVFFASHSARPCIQSSQQWRHLGRRHLLITRDHHWFSKSQLTPICSYLTTLTVNRLDSLFTPSHRLYSTVPDKDSRDSIKETKSATELSSEKTEEQKEIEVQKPKGIFQRFKEAYKEYGKALIAVHLVTSAGWFGGFFYAASM